MTQNLNSICDVPGIAVGHAQDFQAKTGCTVILPETGAAVAGVDVRGSAPGTREIEAIKLVRLVPHINAVLFAGGSAFGLDAAGGVQQFLEERKIGFDVGVTHVPIVPTAVIFDLLVGEHKIRPDKKMGYQAALNASSEKPEEGCVGAGTGATIGKALGMEFAMNGGVGTACDLAGDVKVGALAVVNALGDIIDASGNIIAGAKDSTTNIFLDSSSKLKNRQENSFLGGQNTTLAVVAVDACLSREEITKVAQMAQDGLARAIIPAHTQFDGDLIIALSVGKKSGDLLSIGITAAEVVSEAIRRAVRIANQ